ncbi:SNF2 family N-terminal domain-containing protein [Thelonectria olida]|uniref:SNF2 family N-terminal domain-containing protein n=1 Tax=Thelonectria olida TaxID=1576542 RepID=A0A9P9AJH9_9HYPO|nr:SNF2 family N-terminal domain-containing protein [Thelonectria olida]
MEPPAKRQKTGRDFICFGMLNIPTIGRASPGSGLCASVEIREKGQIFSAASHDLLASVRLRYANVLELFKNEHIDMDMVLSSQDSSVASNGEQAVLKVILYGNKNLCDALKEVLRAQNLYLQDPISATRDVAYWNPQRYFNSPTARTSDFWATVNEPEAIEEKISYSDPLATFTTGHDLGETKPSSHVQTPLKPHQKQALTFMLNRERGWDLGHPNADLWSLKQNDREAVCEYINNVSGSSQHAAPPDFRGGIIADSMGSGKTLAMIALIAHDRIVMANCLDESTSHRVETTLVVVPPSLLDNWQNELSSHLSNEAFAWHSRHGQSKILKVDELEGIDILLTTYSTVANEWRTKRTESVIFLHRWHRVILDEAHCIKNRSGVTTKAVSHIQSSRRWAVTGTPIQNRLPELQSMLCFIRAYPYSDKDIFDDHIKHEWAGGDANEAVNRLKSLLGFLMLRRSDTTFLPRRTDVKRIVEFGPQELQAYREAAAKTLKCIDGILEATHPGNGYMNALQKINALRLICTIGHSSLGNDFGPVSNEDVAPEAGWTSAASGRALDQFPMLGLSTICVGCQELTDTAAQEPENLVSVHLTKCLRLWCIECFSTLTSDTRLCHCEPVCPSAKLSLHSPSLTGSLPLRAGRKEFPTKIRALVRDLREQPGGTKSIVFSFWKTTLDVAHAALDAAGIPCVQVDGAVPGKNRNAIFDQFALDTNVQVLLLTLSCGAVGLTLTAASRAYLMEPQWNPATEEQAFARIYRIGQAKDVTTVRFVMNKSIEQYILEIQDSKRDLVTVLLSPHQSSSSLVSLEKLRELRTLLK